MTTHDPETNESDTAARSARTIRYAATAGYLTRRVARAEGRGGYAHRCPLAAFEAVAAAVADLPATGGDGTTLDRLADALGLPWTRVNVALEFLKARGVAEVRFGRKTHPASACAFEDAMCEFHALRESGREVGG